MMIDITSKKKFKKSVDVLNECFNTGDIGFYRGFKFLNDERTIGVWFPQMPVIKNGKLESRSSKGWINILSEDGKYIRMYSDRAEDSSDKNWDVIHYTFAKIDGYYKYIGTFVRIKEISKPNDVYFKRIGTSIDLANWEQEIYLDDEGDTEKQIVQMSNEQLFMLARDKGKLHPKKKQARSVTVQVVREQAISQYAKRRAAGKCELCGDDAPFIGKNGQPYLECHHIKWISKGGADNIENTVALCPNCHRKMHDLALPEDVKKLKAIDKYSLV